MPHYLAKTTLHKDRLFRVLYALSILVNLAYFVIRIVYIITGRVKVRAPDEDNATDANLAAVRRQNSAAIAYSIVVLIAEFGGFVLVHAGQQMFTRQVRIFRSIRVTESPNLCCSSVGVICVLRFPKTAHACTKPCDAAVMAL